MRAAALALVIAIGAHVIAIDIRSSGVRVTRSTASCEIHVTTDQAGLAGATSVLERE